MSVVNQNCPLASLPSREAWIEIVGHLLAIGGAHGRFPRGKRGLKLPPCPHKIGLLLSLPSREAWIEICRVGAFQQVLEVASLAGSVD